MNKFLFIKLLIIFSILVSGCGDDVYEKSLNETDENGKIIFHKEKGEVTLRYTLRNDFGLKVINKFGWFSNDVDYYFISGKEKKEYRTRDINKLLFLLKTKVPAGSRVDHYSTCTNGWHYKLAPGILNSIARFCKENGIVYYRGQETILCTCGKNGP